jgi:hypothetical protein
MLVHLGSINFEDIEAFTSEGKSSDSKPLTAVIISFGIFDISLSPEIAKKLPKLIQAAMKTHETLYRLNCLGTPKVTCIEDYTPEKHPN